MPLALYSPPMPSVETMVRSRELHRRPEQGSRALHGDSVVLCFPGASQLSHSLPWFRLAKGTDHHFSTERSSNDKRELNRQMSELLVGFLRTPICPSTWRVYLLTVYTRFHITHSRHHVVHPVLRRTTIRALNSDTVSQRVCMTGDRSGHHIQ